MIYLILSVICNAMIGIVMRFSQGRVKGSHAMLSVNYIICLIAAAYDTGVDRIFTTQSGAGLTAILGIVTGLFFFLSLVYNQKAIASSGIVLSSILAKLGALLIPLLISIAFFGEVPKTVQVIGSVIAVASIILMNYDKNQTAPTGSVVTLLILLVVEGLASSGSKVFGELAPEALSPNYLFWTFLSALTICTSVVVKNKEKMGLNEFVFGALIGIPNFLGARVTLLALKAIPAVIVYPVRSVGAIMITTLFGIVFFKEKLRKMQWVAMAAIIVALVLLNI